MVDYRQILDIEVEIAFRYIFPVRKWSHTTYGWLIFPIKLMKYTNIEIYETKHNLNPSFTSYIFEGGNVHYDLRNNLGIPKARTTS